MRIINVSLLSLSILISPLAISSEEEFVARDGEVTLSQDEFSYAVGRWTPQMRDVASKDEGDRLELLNLVLANKKLAAEADAFIGEHPELLQEYRSGLASYQRDFVLRNYRDRIEFPDFTELAQERYHLEKDKYALVKERRTSSHILFASPPGVPRDEVLVKAQLVLDELRGGADFEELVVQHSQEPGAAAKKGKFDKWMTFGEKGVSPPYSEGLFSIDTVGEYSELVQTQFGVHIIRLDGIKEKSYRPFDDVKDTIVKELEAEYVKLAMKDFVSKFQMSGDTEINQDAIKEVLDSYNAK